MDEFLTAVPACQPVAPWIGGKARLAKQIIPRLKEIPHTTYVEPFMGMGGIFLRRPWRSKSEVINDLSADVVTLFRVLQRHYEAFMDMLRWQITSREQFAVLRRANPDSLTDLERAARFLYLQRLAFSGNVRNPNFAISAIHPGRFDVVKLGSMLEAVHERLSAVTIERLPYAELIARYDKPTTLFYLDPPYWGCEGHYGDGLFSPADFAAMAALLRGIKGRFVLSLNDVPEVRQTFAGFGMTELEVSYSFNPRSAGKRFGELLISKGL